MSIDHLSAGVEPPSQRLKHLVTAGERVIVTGGSGFIGSNLVAFYRDCGAEVINIDKLPPRDEAQRPLWREADIVDAEPYRSMVREFKPDLFFHLAARTDLDETDDLNGYAANTVGVENTFDAIADAGSVKRAIITSSQLVCRPGYTPSSETDYNPHTLYGWSKVLTECFTRQMKDPACPWTMVRPTSIWGPWFDIPYRNFFLAVAKRRYVHQSGVNPLRSFGFAWNCVHEYVSLTRAPEERVSGKTFYMADVEPIHVRDWANMIQREMGVAKLREVPLAALKCAAKGGDLLKRVGWSKPPLTSFRLKNLTGDNVADLAPVSEVIGEQPYTIEEGVRVTVAWLREHKLIDVPGRAG